MLRVMMILIYSYCRTYCSLQTVHTPQYPAVRRLLAVSCRPQYPVCIIASMSNSLWVATMLPRDQQRHSCQAMSACMCVSYCSMPSGCRHCSGAHSLRCPATSLKLSFSLSLLIFRLFPSAVGWSAMLARQDSFHSAVGWWTMLAGWYLMCYVNFNYRGHLVTPEHTTLHCPPFDEIITNVMLYVRGLRCCRQPRFPSDVVV